MIEAQSLTKQFDTFTAVRELSLSIQKGELLALLGPNGAGKTTTVRMLSAILRPSSGRAIVNGYDVITQADQVRRSIGMLTEQPGLYGRMSGLEYLTFYGRLYGLHDEEIRQRSLTLFDRFAMPQTAQRRLSEYSKGMRQKVGIIRAMLHNPTVLLLDEPTSAMDPHSAKLVRDAILELRQDQCTIILCTHNLAEAELLADRLAIIRRGEIVAQGAPPALKAQLLGRPQVELELERPLNGEWQELEQLVSLDYQSGTTVRYRTDDVRRVNPQVVRCLTDLGVGVVALREVTQSMEEMYLRVVADGEEDSNGHR